MHSGQQKTNLRQEKEGVEQIGRSARNSESLDDDEKYRRWYTVTERVLEVTALCRCCKQIICRALAIVVTSVITRFCIQMMWNYVEYLCFLLIDCQKSILVLPINHLVIDAYVSVLLHVLLVCR